MPEIKNNISRYRNLERGASAIEFAFLFPFFLIILYAIISYALVFLFAQTLSSMSAEVARSAIAIYTDPRINTSEWEEIVSTRMQNVVRNSWINAEIIDGCAESEIYHSLNSETELLTVCLQINSPVPSLNLFGLRIPHLNTIRSQSSLQLP